MLMIATTVDLGVEELMGGGWRREEPGSAQLYWTWHIFFTSTCIFSIAQPEYRPRGRSDYALSLLARNFHPRPERFKVLAAPRGKSNTDFIPFPLPILI
jgi:hypothetical protein